MAQKYMIHNKDLRCREVAWRQLLGQNANQIAPALNITPASVRFLLRSPEFEAVAAEVRNEAFDNLKRRVQTDKENLYFDIVEAARPAFDELKKLMTSAANEQVRLKACTDILNRAEVGSGTATRDWAPDPVVVNLLVQTLQETKTPAPEAELCQK